LSKEQNHEDPEQPRNRENPAKSGPASQPVKAVNPVEVMKEEGAKEENQRKRQRPEQTGANKIMERLGPDASTSAPMETQESPNDRTGGYGPSSGPVNPNQMDDGGIHNGGNHTIKRSIDLDDYGMRVMKRKLEESKGMKRQVQGEESEMKRHVGESQGRIDKSMDLDSIQAEEWEAIKEDQRQNKIPLMRIRGKDEEKGTQACRIQDMGGEFYVWSTPKEHQSHLTIRRMNHIGGKGIILGENKIWTNSLEIMKRLRDEFHRRKWMKDRRIHVEEKELKKESMQNSAIVTV